MRARRIAIADEPDNFITRAAAKRMVSLGRAEFTPAGTLRLFAGGGDARDAEPGRVRWSSYSGVVPVPGSSFLGGYLMNGAALNRSEP